MVYWRPTDVTTSGNPTRYENEYALDRKAKKSTLYMMDCYNTKIFHPKNKMVEESVARIHNALTEGLNANQILPKFIIVIIDKDIIEDLNIFDYGAHKGLALHIDWITKNIDIKVHRKRLQLLEKRPGSVLDENEPTIIYVTMIHRIEHYHKGSALAKICSLGRKFNELLNEFAARHGHRILSIRSCTRPEHFTDKATLSKVGKEAVCWEIDDLIERFENDQVKLLPRPKVRDNSRKPSNPAPDSTADINYDYPHRSYEQHSNHRSHDNNHYDNRMDPHDFIRRATGNINPTNNRCFTLP